MNDTEPLLDITGEAPKEERTSKRTDADRAKDRERWHQRKRDGTATNRGGRPKGGSMAAQEKELKSRATRVFERVADRRDLRGDDELADALREEGGMMADLLVTLTDALKPLRMPLLLALGIIEPVLACGRVLGILTRRLNERRTAVVVEQPVDEHGRPVDEHGNVIPEQPTTTFA